MQCVLRFVAETSVTSVRYAAAAGCGFTSAVASVPVCVTPGGDTISLPVAAVAVSEGAAALLFLLL